MISRAAAILWLAAQSAFAATHCVVCQQDLGPEFYWVNSPAFAERQSVCLACAKLKTLCSACQLPVKADAFHLDDGRRFCPTHSHGLVLTQREAEDVFLETQRVLFPFLRGCGTLPHLNITVRLADARQMARMAKQLRRGADQFATVGLTTTRPEGGAFSHTIFLLSGLARPALMAAAAHEYTHAWLNENVPPSRKLDRDAVEGFCELMAYKVMSELHDEAEMQLILKNAYTRGQIDTFVQAGDTNRLLQVVQWIKSGVGERIRSSPARRKPEPKKAERSLAAKSRPAPAAVPDTLQLLGVSGPLGRRFALINNQTFRAGETARVRVGTSNVLVRCVTIAEKSAEIELRASGQREVLELSNRP